MVAKLTVALQDDGPFRLDVQLSCATGEILALVGPSGSGKSRVLRSIAGLYRPKRGEIIYGDEVWYDPAKAVNLTPQQRRIGIVFQNYALFPHLGGDGFEGPPHGQDHEGKVEKHRGDEQPVKAKHQRTSEHRVIELPDR